jgi:NAD(P)-dependent dehydrogenase (short-subunit alcohol dehydrogenase family)
MPEVVILGVTSDIGRELAQRFTSDGWSVTGTYRSTHHLPVVSANSR